jgi:dsDNA-specific endonuclease/ATPase MutS2
MNKLLLDLGVGVRLSPAQAEAISKALDEVEALKQRINELERLRLELAINHFQNAIAKADALSNSRNDWIDVIKAYAKELERKSREWC